MPALLPAGVFHVQLGTALLVLFLTVNQLLPFQLVSLVVCWLPFRQLLRVRALL